MSKRYLVIGGNPFKTNTGAVTFVGLNVHYKSDSLEDIKEKIAALYDQASGLIMIIDTLTGEELNLSDRANLFTFTGEWLRNSK